jgi:hypothetical protein
MLAEPAQPTYVSKYRKKVEWNRHFGSKHRGAVLTMSRLATKNVGSTVCVTFQRSEGESAASNGSNRVTLRLPTGSSLASVQQQVGKRFGWNEAAVLYQKDVHGWEVPITSEVHMNHAFQEWELTSGPRTRFKYDALFKEVEQLVSETDKPAAMLRGAVSPPRRKPQLLFSPALLRGVRSRRWGGRARRGSSRVARRTMSFSASRSSRASTRCCAAASSHRSATPPPLSICSHSTPTRRHASRHASPSRSPAPSVSPTRRPTMRFSRSSAADPPLSSHDSSWGQCTACSTRRCPTTRCELT